MPLNPLVSSSFLFKQFLSILVSVSFLFKQFLIDFDIHIDIVARPKRGPFPPGGRWIRSAACQAYEAWGAAAEVWGQSLSWELDVSKQIAKKYVTQCLVSLVAVVYKVARPNSSPWVWRVAWMIHKNPWCGVLNFISPAWFRQKKGPNFSHMLLRPNSLRPGHSWNET